MREFSAFAAYGRVYRDIITRTYVEDDLEHNIFLVKSKDSRTNKVHVMSGVRTACRYNIGPLNLELVGVMNRRKFEAALSAGIPDRLCENCLRVLRVQVPKVLDTNKERLIPTQVEGG